MSADLRSLREELAAFPLAHECEALDDGSIRIVTPLLYPDGSRVEILHYPKVDLFGSSRLSDQGRTAAMLAGYHVVIEGYEKRQQILTSICDTLGVHHSSGELSVIIPPGEGLADALLRLAQACVRAADLHYTQSFRAQSDFHEIFSAFLHQERPDNIEEYSIEGRFGRRIKVDFYTHQGREKDNLIITLFSANETSSHAVANDVFCRWYDLDRYREKYQFITVVDSTSKSFRAADLNRVASVSRVLSYPAETDTLRELLAAPKV